MGSLAEEVGGFFGGLFTGGAANIVQTVGNVIDKFHTSDEQRISLENEIRKAEMSYKVEMKSLDIKETGLYLADVDSARDNQSRIQESEHSSWLSKNTQPLLALLLVGLCFGMFGNVLFGGLDTDPQTSNITMMILGGLISVLGQVVSYFFGASRDSGENTKKMSEIASKINNK